MSTYLSAAASHWFARHHGIATTAELRRLGLGHKALERLVSIGVLRRAARGVYVTATAQTTLAHRCRLLCCLYPAGFVTGPTAAVLAGLRRQPRRFELHFSLPHGIHPAPMLGVRFRQSTKVASHDRIIRSDGIIVASWPRLGFDLAADLPALDHRSVTHQLLDRGLVTGDELEATGRRLCHPARRGTTVFRLSLLEIGDGIQDSHPEVRLGDALLRRGMPIEAQFEVDLGDPTPRHLDLAVPGARWGIELDIHPEHRSVDGHHRDARRVRSLHLRGWQIEPVAELDVVDDPTTERTADELVVLYREWVAQLQPSTECPHTGHSVLG
jgi:hypothetical protein